jgi:hypothetical protein
MRILDAEYRLSKRPVIDNFGLVVIDAERATANADGVAHVKNILETYAMPPEEDEGHKSSTRMSRLLGAISSQSDASWFRVSEMFGHPAPEMAGSLLTNMNELARAIKKQNASKFQTSVQQLRADMCIEMLDSYLSVARDGAEPTKEADWAYIIGLPNHRAPLQIGACDGDILDVVADLNRRNAGGKQVFGLLGAWLVHDPDEVAEGLRVALQDSEILPDLYDINLGAAKFSIETFLKETDNFVLSPWHVADEDVVLAMAG